MAAEGIRLNRKRARLGAALSVNFSAVNHMVIVANFTDVCDSDKSNLWYHRQELRAMKDQAVELMRIKRERKFFPESEVLVADGEGRDAFEGAVSTRGLEYMARTEHMVRRRRERSAVRRAVLREQLRQKLESGWIYDPVKVADASALTTQNARKRALLLGTYDFNVARTTSDSHCEAPVTEETNSGAFDEDPPNPPNTTSPVEDGDDADDGAGATALDNQYARHSPVALQAMEVLKRYQQQDREPRKRHHDSQSPREADVVGSMEEGQADKRRKKLVGEEGRSEGTTSPVSVASIPSPHPFFMPATRTILVPWSPKPFVPSLTLPVERSTYPTYFPGYVQYS